MTVDLIVLAYKPDKMFLEMIDLMSTQTVNIGKIIIINVEQKFYDRLVYSTKFVDEHKNVQVRHLSKREYDCGKSRNLGVQLSDADAFLMISQNAIPDSKELLSKLVASLESDKSLAVAYARQVLPESAKEYDKFIRRYFFPQDSSVKSLKDVSSDINNAYRCSNMCALYRRAIFDELGGFNNHVLFGEDILYAAKAINEGYKVSYVADAIVVDTACPQLKDEPKIAFDYAVSMLKHPECSDVNAMKNEFKKLDKLTVSHLARNGHKKEIREYKRVSRQRRKGFNKGLKYKRIALGDMGRFSANADYWRLDEILRDRSSVDVHSGYGRSEAEKEMLSKPPVLKRKNDD